MHETRLKETKNRKGNKMDVENYIFFKRHNAPEKGRSSHLFRFKNKIRGYWYKQQAELLVRLQHARKHSRIGGFTDVFQRAMGFLSHHFIDKFKSATPPLLQIIFKGVPTTRKKNQNTLHITGVIN